MIKPLELFCSTVLALFTVYAAIAQDHRGCATPAWEQIVAEKAPHIYNARPGSNIFENWMADKLQEPVAKNPPILTIPVVVHVIHQGEPIGSGRNLSDERIFSQIRILNEDFRRKPGTPGFNTHPAGADTRIEFKLAQRTPDGQPTNGIVRIQGPQPTYSLADNNLLKNLSIWSADDYLNIWVCDLVGNFLGYAQFPTPFDSLPYSGQYENILPDGVVIDYQVFGDVPQGESGSFGRYNKGRTATHEIGHFLGLIHLWGDVQSGCGDDFCPDTPLQNNWTSGCPQNRVSCGGPNMFRNYLDYTNDSCMNIFTNDQMNRMRVVLRNSPRRKSLTTSLGAEPPVSVKPRLSSNDIKIFPNPSDGRIQIEDAKGSLREIVVTDPAGKVLYQKYIDENLSNTITVNLQSLPKGIYFLVCLSKQGSVSKKIIIQ
jgi:hypothetical protein